MKKLNFRAVLILLLVVVLSFALVACGDKDKDDDGGKKPTPKPSTGTIEDVKSYFNTLWDLTSGIGSEAVAENEDLQVSLDLGITLQTVDTGAEVKQEIALGLGIEAILDRSHQTEKNSDNTAFKINISAGDDETVATVYYFFNDPANVYIDFAGQNIQIPYNLELPSKDTDDGKFTPEDFSAFFYNWLYNDKFTEGALANKSIADVLAYFTDGLGSNWTLNSLVGGVTQLFNLDIKGMLFPTDPKDSPLGMDLTSILGSIGLTKDNMFDTNGNLDIKSILTNESLATMLFNATKTRVTATSAHTEINMATLGGLLSSFIGDLGSIINSSLGISLDYGINNGEIDGFDIGLTFGSITAMVDGAEVSPKVILSVNDLSIGKASKSGLKMAADKSKYTNEVAVDAKVALDLKGISIDLDALLDEAEAPATSANEDAIEATPSWGDTIKERLSTYLTKNNIEGIALDGALEIGVYGKVDVASRPDVNKDEVNKTSLKAWVKYGKANIVEMSFVGDRIAVKVNQDATIGGVKVVDALISLFGDNAYDLLVKYFGYGGKDFAAQLFADETHLVVNSQFKGAVWSGINLGKNFNDLINKAMEWIGGSEETPEETPEGNAATSAEDSTITKVIKTIQKVLPYINTKNGLTIDVTGKTVGQAVAEIGGIWDSAMSKQENFIGTIVDWDKDEYLATVIKMISLKGVEYNDATEFLTKLFASNAKVNIDLGKDGISLDVDVDVNEDCGVELSIEFSASKLTAITDLGADVTEVGNGWYYYAF